MDAQITSDPYLSNLDYSCMLGKAMLDEQSKTIETLLFRSNIIIGLSGVLIGFLILGLPARNLFLMSFYLTSLSLLTIPMIELLLITRFIEFRYIIDPEDLWDLLTDDGSQFRKQILSNITDAFDHNHTILGRHERTIVRSIEFLITGLTSMIIYAFMYMIW